MSETKATFRNQKASIRNLESGTILEEVEQRGKEESPPKDKEDSDEEVDKEIIIEEKPTSPKEEEPKREERPRKLGIGEVKPTTISVQFADKSIKHPMGIIEDVLVKVDKFIFSADFFVLDMEEDKEIPLVLGRQFLAC
ncbi:uncharacterized protein LOC116127130 [Pistacia vera]|uniref:uncharacterized protein LOC116127130 n=1 Tax=Pistacia vera TaxID=55513 RepID=UPI0012632B6D|nr:uncharacterized protein LOC116127130 [Pistacia vera]